MKNISTKSQLGFSIVELVVTLLVGMVVSFGVANMLISSNRAASLNDTLMEPQDNGRFLLSLMAREIRHAGQSGVARDKNNQLYIAETEANLSGCVSDEITCHENHNDGGDNSGFSTGDRLTLITRPSKTDPTDCAGNGSGLVEITENPNTGVDFLEDQTYYEEILNSYWVEQDAVTGVYTFVCKSYRKDPGAVNGWLEEEITPTPLTYNVEAMQVLYGENLRIPFDADGNPIDPSSPIADLARSERVVDRYVTADQVTDWRNIYAIKIAFLVRSENETLENKVRKYTLLDSKEYSFEDGYVRQIFSSTFAFANYKTSTFLL